MNQGATMLEQFTAVEGDEMVVSVLSLEDLALIGGGQVVVNTV